MIQKGLICNGSFVKEYTKDDVLKKLSESVSKYLPDTFVPGSSIKFEIYIDIYEPFEKGVDADGEK